MIETRKGTRITKAEQEKPYSIAIADKDEQSAMANLLNRYAGRIKKEEARNGLNAEQIRALGVIIKLGNTLSGYSRFGTANNEVRLSLTTNY